MSRHVGRVGAMNLFELWIGEGLPWRSGAVWGTSTTTRGLPVSHAIHANAVPTPRARSVDRRGQVAHPTHGHRGDVPRRTVIDARSRVVCVKARDGQT